MDNHGTRFTGHPRQHGAFLVSLIFLLVLVGAGVAALTTTLLTDIVTSDTQRDGVRALYAAESGLERTSGFLRDNPDLSDVEQMCGTLDDWTSEHTPAFEGDEGGNFSVSAGLSPDENCLVTITGWTPEGDKENARAQRTVEVVFTDALLENRGHAPAGSLLGENYWTNLSAGNPRDFNTDLDPPRLWLSSGSGRDSFNRNQPVDSLIKEDFPADQSWYLFLSLSARSEGVVKDFGLRQLGKVKKNEKDSEDANRERMFVSSHARTADLKELGYDYAVEMTGVTKEQINHPSARFTIAWEGDSIELDYLCLGTEEDCQRHSRLSADQNPIDVEASTPWGEY
ncbi:MULTISPECIES: pilus assembly PilX N-terminal domain-containing protein [Halorhodospira]|uniref:pilus assembly PilX family protein n=1 Tax=Halorhodospira TaxID=85108 RepID=UPI001EE8D63C|nr:MULTISPECIES: pilus assembly PilX N-terminal domain-containing protein [Halorhodospira]MCG5528636.1 pilus assembly PilX N-terminal domain-containing protein [Halorhodospira halophila]MCG5543963.1 pilus assembly PilX N-terminal domain-containing protein [Halorhodospira sp. 9628]